MEAKDQRGSEKGEERTEEERRGEMYKSVYKWQLFGYPVMKRGTSGHKPAKVEEVAAYKRRVPKSSLEDLAHKHGIYPLIPKH